MEKFSCFLFFFLIDTMEDPVKKDLGALLKKYDEFITHKLKPSLKKELGERDAIFNSIAE